MIPNPQSALPLPARPNIEHYRKLAKKMVKAGEAEKLTAAQFFLARTYGFESWPKFVKHLENLARKSPVSRFEAAADAIVEGDIATLQRLLREDPKLVRAKSTRVHGATLLHYVSANGVEGYRQKTPGNIVEITQLLLEAGAEVDAAADVYGGGCTTLGLAATSVHPQKAGVQEALMETLLDAGADRNLRSAGNGHSLVFACLANGQPRAAKFLGDHGTKLAFVDAAGIGRLDFVRDQFPTAGVVERRDALLYSCLYGRNEVAAFLLQNGGDLAAHSSDGQTALHMAVIGGQLETVKLLLKHKPPVEAVNRYGGSVVGQTLWSAAHGGDPDVYIGILQTLVDAGAQLPEKHVPVNERIDAWLAARSSIAQPEWHWYGEKPSK